MRRAAGFLLLLLAFVPLALLVTLTYGLTSTYDFVVSQLQPLDALIVVSSAWVALLLLLAARKQLGATRPPTAVLAVTVLAVFAGSAAASAVLGGAAHDREAAAVGTACSEDDQELLAAVEFPGYRDGPHGEPDGGCRLRLYPTADASTAVAELDAVLRRDGWQPAEPRDGTAVLTRGGAVLTVSSTTDDKTTEIVLTLH